MSNIALTMVEEYQGPWEVGQNFQPDSIYELNATHFRLYLLYSDGPPPKKSQVNEYI